MSWNYRVVKNYHVEGEEYFAIHEVYYDDDGNPKACTALPVAFLGNDIADLKAVLDMAKQACDKPVLDYYEDFPIL